MDKAQKLEYQQNLEGYLEDNQVYELFESLMKLLVINRPDEPIDFLINKLTHPEPKRIFIVGPPGSNRKEYALALAEYFNYTCISVGDLLNKEISKKSEYGKEIAEARKTYSYVSDEIVIDLVKKQISQIEKEQKSWIIEGFPRTRVQALNMQKLGIIPDKFILLNVNDANTFKKVKTNLMNRDSKHQTLYDSEIDALSNSAMEEYKLHISGVKDVCRGFIYEISADKAQDEVLEDIARILRLRMKTNAPRRPPRIIIVGPPGSGRTTQAKILAQKYGLVRISTTELLREEVSKKTDKGKLIGRLMSQGELVPDEIIINLVEQRVCQTDCKINGWILDGFPKTEAQISLLKSLKINPSLVSVLEVNDTVAFERLEHRRIDPLTGTHYNIQKDAPKDEEVLTRLVQNDEDSHEVVKRRLQQWKGFLTKLDETYKSQLITVNGEKECEEVTELISDAIENPVF